MTHTMHHAKIVFHKACTGASCAIQATTVLQGLYDLSVGAQIKYGVGQKSIVDEAKH